MFPSCIKYLTLTFFKTVCLPVLFTGLWEQQQRCLKGFKCPAAVQVRILPHPTHPQEWAREGKRFHSCLQLFLQHTFSKSCCSQLFLTKIAISLISLPFDLFNLPHHAKLGILPQFKYLSIQREKMLVARAGILVRIFSSSYALGLT